MARVRRQKLPPNIENAEITGFTHDGRGVVRMEGKAVFVSGALPNEVVDFSYVRTHRDYDEARVTCVHQSSSERAEPGCAHFGICGGCSMQHLLPNAQIRFKAQQLQENFSRIGQVSATNELPPLTANPWGYRLKARLGAKYVRKKERVLVGFREKDSGFLADLSRCEVLHPSVGHRLTEIAECIQSLSIREAVPQIEVAVGTEEVALSFRVLQEPSAADQDALRALGEILHYTIYIQSGNHETLQLLYRPAAISEDTLYYALPQDQLRMNFLPYHFTQINAGINEQMIPQALDLLQLTGKEQVLDLFCGLGNFTLPLARRAAHVTGVEGDENLVQWARANALRNQIENVDFFAADLTADQTKQPWLQHTYDAVLVDPPRSGAQEMMPHLARLGAKRIVYVSCHPATLARDAGILVNNFGYQLHSAGVMDMFPHTAHVESMALFVKP